MDPNKISNSACMRMNGVFHSRGEGISGEIACNTLVLDFTVFYVKSC